MSEVVRLRLELQNYKEGRRAIAQVLRDTRKSLTLSKEERDAKLASLRATQQGIREQEVAVRAQLGRARLQDRADALRGRSFGQGGQALSTGLGRAGQALSISQQGGQILSDFASGSASPGQVLGGIGGLLSFFPATALAGQGLSAIAAIVQPMIDAAEERAQRARDALATQLRRELDEAMKSVAERAKEDFGFASEEGRKNLQFEIGTLAAYAQAGVTPVDRKRISFE